MLSLSLKKKERGEVNPDWVQVRLRRETHAALREFGARVLRLVHQGRTTDVPCDTDQLGIDVLIRVLLERDAAKQERNRRSGEAKKQRRANRGGSA